MIPVALRFSPSVLLAVLASAGLSMAGDIIKLKSGEKYDGKILSESPAEVTIEIQVGRIKETKTVLRKDIVELVKATPAQIEAAELAKLVPLDKRTSDYEPQPYTVAELRTLLAKLPGCGLLQSYGIHKTIREARSRGLRTHRRQEADGSILLTLEGGSL